MNKSDLKQIKSIVDDSLKGLATKKDLERFATKDELKNELKALKKELKAHTDDAFAILAGSTIKRKADREDVEKLEVRVEKLEQHAY